MRVLIVEDEMSLATRMASSLRHYGLTCEIVGTAEDAEQFAFEGFQVLAVDLGLPGASGLDLVRSLRAKGLATPILILTARSSWQEKVEALNAGADDFIVKPVRIEELVARIQALARRSAGQAQAEMRVGDVSLDPASRQVRVGTTPVDLTATEFRLLTLFFYNKGRVLSQAAILDHLYPLDTERESNTVEVHVGRLRRKLGADRILTMRGHGYRLAAMPEAQA